jgi:lipoprotein-anchoring transpeptidase ErfK/SrfK
MLQNHKRILILGLCAMIVIIVLVIIMSLHPKPPLQKIEMSRIALSQASKADAENYAQETFTEAKHNWEKALQIWHQENNKLFFRRSFKQLEQKIDTAIFLARQSERYALQTRDSLKNVARVELVLLLEKLNEFKSKFDQMPIDELLRKKITQGELLVLEGQVALKRADIQKALQKFKMAEKIIGQSGKEVTEMLNEYLKNIPMWRKWAEETIKFSKENKEVAIIVDKFDHTVHVYDKGQFTQKYSIELGKNWIGHKRQKGDHATPEGQYSISKKIQNGQSKYYKALVIDYPNAKDIENFTATKKRGDLPKDAQIGGSIEIHGDGGKGINWTQGCIAMKNDDVDKIFDIVKIGTPVTIVGSLNGATNHKTSK